MEPNLPGAFWKMKLEQKECFIRSDSAATPGRELSLRSHISMRFLALLLQILETWRSIQTCICLDELNCLISEGLKLEEWVIPELWEV